jgi:anti-anti-sigma regulatory factor
VFISHLQNLTERDISLTLYQMTPRVRDIFQLMGLDRFLTISPCHPDFPSPPQTASFGL